MKKIIFVALVGVLAACSSDDGSGDGGEVVTPNAGTPLAGFTEKAIILTKRNGIPPIDQEWERVDLLTDEFDQTDGLDTSKWSDVHPRWAGRPPSNFKKENNFVEKGYLNLRSTLLKDPGTVANPLSDIWVNSAVCVSKANSAKPGYYYEASIKASSLSMTSSFWFRIGEFSEIDVIEHIGDPSVESRKDDLPFKYSANTHVYGPQEGPAAKGKSYTMPVRGRDQFNVYGLWWKSPTELLFYYNGVEVMDITPPVPFDEDLVMIFDTEVFPFATAGVPSIGLPLPENLDDNSKNTMKVDFVRTYKMGTSFDSGILANGSFEKQNTGWLGNGDVELTTKTSNVFSGALALELKDKGAIIQEITVEKNTDYKLDWNAIVRSGSLTVEVLDIADKKVSDAVWTPGSLDFNSGDNAKIYVKFISADNTTTVLDNIALTKK